MLVFNSQAALGDYLLPIWQSGARLGFVPTMGALHQGHLSLMQQSMGSNPYTVVSIFVNPTQFNNPEDLEKYPRTLEADLVKIAALNPDIIVFAPTVQDMYPENTSAQTFDFDGLENQMEGRFRPGHFDGVGTVVKRLFEIVKPAHAYFGEKDFQQVQIVKKLVEKYQIPVNIVLCPIHREPNGLAMSSRNERLSVNQREAAAVIFKTLQTAKANFGTKSVGEIIADVEGVFEQQQDFELEYFEIADEQTLESAKTTQKNREYRAFIAVFAGQVRLIDTISLN